MQEDLNGRIDQQSADKEAGHEFAILPQLLDTKQAAVILNVDPRTVTRMCAQGKIKAVKVMSLWRINRDALLEFAGLGE